MLKTNHDERTENLPVQEMVSFVGETMPVLSAEQVYAQRLSEMIADSSASAPRFIP